MTQWKIVQSQVSRLKDKPPLQKKKKKERKVIGPKSQPHCRYTQFEVDYPPSTTLHQPVIVHWLGTHTHTQHTLTHTHTLSLSLFGKQTMKQKLSTSHDHLTAKVHPLQRQSFRLHGPMRQFLNVFSFRAHVHKMQNVPVRDSVPLLPIASAGTACYIFVVYSNCVPDHCVIISTLYTW